MKKNILIAVISFLVVSFVLEQCTKENTNEVATKTKQKVELRSQAQENIIRPPINCGPEDYREGILCFLGKDSTKTIILENGCELSVTMYIEICQHTITGDIYVNFSNLRWRPKHLFPDECNDYLIGIWAKSVDDSNDDIDELNDEIADKFQTGYMTDFVIEREISCDANFNYASSMYFKAICTQRCVTPPGEENAPVFFTDTPCATDGCCVSFGHYCVQSDGKIYISKSIELISPCSDFHSVDCGDLFPWGDCRDIGCTN